MKKLPFLALLGLVLTTTTAFADTPVYGLDISSVSIDGSPIGATTPSTGAFTTLEANDLVIGSTYTGAQTPPVDGLLVEGRASFGSASPVSYNHFSIYDTASLDSASAAYIQQASTNYTNTYSLFANHNGSPAGAGTYTKNGIVSQLTIANGNAYDVSTLNGVQSLVYHNGNGTVSTARGLWIYTNTGGTSTGTIINQYGAYVQGGRVAGSTITTGYGLRITGFDANTIYGLHIGGSTCTTCFDIYASNSGATNYFAGNVGVGTSSPTEALDVNANTIRVRAARTPASASEACASGEIAWDTGYVYVCTATNAWKRAALSTW